LNSEEKSRSFTGNNAGDIRKKLYRTDILNEIEILYCEEETTFTNQRTDGGKRE
jgi:hypothetical protein